MEKRYKIDGFDGIYTKRELLSLEHEMSKNDLESEEEIAQWKKVDNAVLLLFGLYEKLHYFNCIDEKNQFRISETEFSDFFFKHYGIKTI